jgi:hypothetical protein
MVVVGKRPKVSNPEPLGLVSSEKIERCVRTVELASAPL